MYKTSEYVSLGHPDKIADFISCYILDRYMEKDKNTRYALEVQIKDNYVSLGGEITSKAQFTETQINDFVKAAVKEIGYTKLYQNIWGKENTICDEDLVITQHISKQSPDIAQGVDADGWGDQGIYWGLAVNNEKTGFMPYDHYLAQKIGKSLYDNRTGGLDIKTQITLLDEYPQQIIVAIPMLYRNSDKDVENTVKNICGVNEGYKLIINGTGRYVKHGPVGDCGTTGRKLAVDFYGGNARIGGGSPWTKDGTKADLTLNLYARDKALNFLKKNNSYKEIHAALSCKIGSPQVLIVYFDENMRQIYSKKEIILPKHLIEKYKLNTPIYSKLCKNGLFDNIM